MGGDAGRHGVEIVALLLVEFGRRQCLERGSAWPRAGKGEERLLAAAVGGETLDEFRAASTTIEAVGAATMKSNGFQKSLLTP